MREKKKKNLTERKSRKKTKLYRKKNIEKPKTDWKDDESNKRNKKKKWNKINKKNKKYGCINILKRKSGSFFV